MNNSQRRVLLLIPSHLRDNGAKWDPSLTLPPDIQRQTSYIGAVGSSFASMNQGTQFLLI